ncbi:MAG: hypothetical protein ABIQ61_00155 [Ornithinibacter sp.]
MNESHHDAERLADVVHVLHGPDGTGAVRRVLYAVYVVGILSLTYGFTVTRALFITSDPQWVRDNLLGAPAAAVAVASGVALLVAARAVGRVRGPAVPPLPWVDHVVSGPIDRADTLREWWVVSSTLLLAGSTVLGGVLGGGLWASGTTGPLALLVAVLVGASLGGALALLWLAGQLAAGGGAAVPDAGRPGRNLLRRPRASLGLLTLPGLRAQSTRSTHLGGAVLAGDLRAARLEVAMPVRRGRGLRLRSRGRLVTVVSRDILGLRRQPGLLGGGGALSLAGSAGVAWSVTNADVPAALAVVSMVLCYLGIGVWAEGLRLLGDTLGTPGLSGLPIGVEALAHSVLPTGLFVVVGVPVGLGVHAVVGAPSTTATAVSLWMVGVAVLVVAAHWVASFRGQPPDLVFLPELGPAAMAFWYARPLILAGLTGGLLTARLGASGLFEPAAIALLITLTGAGFWARRALRSAADAHRV